MLLLPLISCAVHHSQTLIDDQSLHLYMPTEAEADININAQNSVFIFYTLDNLDINGYSRNSDGTIKSQLASFGPESSIIGIYSKDQWYFNATSSKSTYFKGQLVGIRDDCTQIIISTLPNQNFEPKSFEKNAKICYIHAPLSNYDMNVEYSFGPSASGAFYDGDAFQSIKTELKGAGSNKTTEQRWVMIYLDIGDNPSETTFSAKFTDHESENQDYGVYYTINLNDQNVEFVKYDPSAGTLPTINPQRTTPQSTPHPTSTPLSVEKGASLSSRIAVAVLAGGVLIIAVAVIAILFYRRRSFPTESIAFTEEPPSPNAVTDFNVNTTSEKKDKFHDQDALPSEIHDL